MVTAGSLFLGGVAWLFGWSVKFSKMDEHLSNEKRAPGCLWYMGMKSYPGIRDYNKPL